MYPTKNIWIFWFDIFVVKKTKTNKEKKYSSLEDEHVHISDILNGNNAN